MNACTAGVGIRRRQKAENRGAECRLQKNLGGRQVDLLSTFLPPKPPSCRRLCPLSSALCSLLSVFSVRRQAVKLVKICAAWDAMVELALHFPTSQVELPSRATMETATIGLALTGKRPAHFPVPATKQPGYPVCNCAPR